MSIFDYFWNIEMDKDGISFSDAIKTLRLNRAKALKHRSLGDRYLSYTASYPSTCPCGNYAQSPYSTSGEINVYKRIP